MNNQITCGRNDSPVTVCTAGRKVLPREFSMKLIDSSGRENLYRITNAELLSGEGSSCMCYLVSVEMSENESHRMLLKQFYPQEAAAEGLVRMDGLALQIDGFEEDPHLLAMADHFAQAYEMQRNLSNMDSTGSHVVTPYRRYFAGSTMYVLYQRENGDTLDRYFPQSAREFLDIAVSAAEAMASLHGQGVLYMDFKPENVLWADGARAMLFDFDAAVDMTRLDEVRGLRSTPRILAPELREMQDFRRNKYLFLTPSADIYSFGSMLIAVLSGVWPSELERSAAGTGDAPAVGWKDAVLAVLGGEFRGQMDQDEQKTLVDILAKCTAEDLRSRYRSAKEVLSDLKTLREEMLRPRKVVRRTNREVERILETAYVLDRYPLWQYRRPEGGRYMLDTGLVGDGDTAVRFFKYLLTTQITDTATVIRWAVPDPARKMTELLHIMPQLAAAAEWILNGEEVKEWEGKPVGTDPEVAAEPLAYIFLEEWDPEGDPEDLFMRWSREEDYTLLPSWIVFADDGGEESRNRELAVGLLRAIAGNNALTPDRGSGRFYPVFIGYADAKEAPGAKSAGFTEGTKERITASIRAALQGVSEDAHEAEEALDHLMKWVVFASVGSHLGSGEAGRSFGKEIRERAEKIHRFFIKDRNERASAQDIRKSFQRDFRYNMESSVSAALSVDAKLVSAGIDPKAPNAAFQFYSRVLSGTPQAEEMLKKLLYLEHRRWSAYMITAGYRVPTAEEFAEYAFNGDNDHRDRRRKLHPLICSSDPEAGIVLRTLPHKYWSRRRQKTEFDALDRQSLRIHRLCDRKAKQMDADTPTEELLADISKFELRGEWARSAEWLRAVIGRMLSGEANINVVFADEMRAFRERVEGLDKRMLSCRLELTEDLDKIEAEMRPVIFRNQYVDYKMSDEAVLRSVPMLIMPPVRRIYKPAAPKLWQNVMSSILIEPEELVLITETAARGAAGDGAGENAERRAERIAEELEHFLREERHLAVKVSVIYGTDDVRTETRSKRAILDITGMDEAAAFGFARRSCFQTMPVTRFADGRLQDFGYGAEIPLYMQKRTLTVEETLRLFGSNPFHEDQGSTMSDLRPYYQQLWNAYRSVKPFYWRIFIQEMEKAERELYIRVSGEVAGRKDMAVSVGPDPESSEDAAEDLLTVKTGSVPGRMLTETGIRRVLREWKQNGLIEPGGTEPAETKLGAIRFETAFPETRAALQEMLRRAEAEPYCHSFEAIQSAREPISGKPAGKLQHYVYDETCLVQFSFRDEAVRDFGGRSVLKSEAVRCVLEALEAVGNVVRTSPLPGETEPAPMISEDYKTGECFVRFETDDISVRKCLLKEGNVLETYVYHTLFQHVPVDDVRSNVTFTWNAKSEEESVFDGAVNNEVDIVCTKNMKTYFISCKQSMPKNEYLEEIRFFADYFGIDGTAVIICSNSAFNEASRKKPTALRERSEGMNVRFIDRTMIDRDLAGCLAEIFCE